jgi:hypothetical protein
MNPVTDEPGLICPGSGQGVCLSDDPPRPLIGRDTERAVLEKNLSELSNGTARVISISGDPGSGKTRMLAEVAAIGRAVGVRVLSGRISISSSNVPLAVLAEALSDHVNAMGVGSPDVIPAHYRDALAAASPFFPFRVAPVTDARASGPLGFFHAVHALIDALAS